MQKSSNDSSDSPLSHSMRHSSIDRQFIESSTGGHHSFDPLEINRFSDIINSALQHDPDLQNVLPLKENSQDLFTSVENGVLMCKLVNCATPGTIEESKINRKANMNIFQKTENINLAISGAKSIGCILVNMNAQLIFDRREHIILGFIWQLMRIKYVSMLNLKKMPTLMVLRENDEKESDFAKASPEELLLRWFNHHLNNSNYSMKIKNFSSDVKNGLAYTYLLNQLSPELSDLQGVEMEIEKRAENVISNAKKMGIAQPMTGADIISGNSKLNLLFCASVFEKYPELKSSKKQQNESTEETEPTQKKEISEKKIELKEVQTMLLEESKELPEVEENKKIEDLIGTKEVENIEQKKPKQEEKTKKSGKKSEITPSQLEEKKKLMAETERKVSEIEEKMKKIKFCWWCLLLRFIFCLVFCVNGYNHLVHEEEFSELTITRFASFDAILERFGVSFPVFTGFYFRYFITYLGDFVAFESVLAIALVLYISMIISHLLIVHLVIFGLLYGGCVQIFLINGFEVNLEMKALAMNFLVLGAGWVLWQKVCWVCKRKEEDK